MRTMAIATAVGATCLGIYLASAADLGGLTSASVGADAAGVPSCDPDGIAIAYTNVFDPATGTYQTTEVILGDIAAACDGKAFNVTLASDTAAVRQLSGWIALNGGSRHVVPVSPSLPSGSIRRGALVVAG